MTSSIQPAKTSKKIIFLFGPTASGKTALTLSHFSKGFQIINADSVQVYKYLDIASAKPSKNLLNKIPHHLIDILSPWQQFTVSDFINRADEAANITWSMGDIPVLSGGTAFYFKHFLFGLSNAPGSDEKVRAEVEELLKEKGREYLFEFLNKVDPKSAKRININDTYRLTRAIEVYLQTGNPLSYYELPTEIRNGMKPFIIGLTREKSELESRIKLRVEQMFDEGVMAEIASLLKMGADESWPGMGGIGYREFLELRKDGEFTIRNVKDLIISNTRKYAKRQMTFFKSFENVHWVNPDDTKELEKDLKEYLTL